MKKLPALCCLFLVAKTSLLAQKGNIQGIVLDKTSLQPMEYASISVFRSSDSVLMEAMATKKDGRISIDVREGHYFLKAGFIG